MPTTPVDRPPVNDHFLALMRQGGHRECSSGARAAHKLAKAIHELVPWLDGQATYGLHEWIEFVKQDPTTAGDMLR